MFDAEGSTGENTDGGDKIIRAFPGKLLGHPAYRRHGCGGSHQRGRAAGRAAVVSGVVGLTLKNDLDAPYADDRG